MRGFMHLTLVATALGLYGCPSCPYDETCDGNTLLTCSLGVDQVVGSPSERSIPCEGANPVCITVDTLNALCAMDEARTCTSDAEPRCEADLRIDCQDGFEVATDCAADSNVCGLVEGEARCHAAPLTVCDAEVETVCEGTQVVSCERGVIVRRDCQNYPAKPVCTPFTNEYGSGAYCGT